MHVHQREIKVKGKRLLERTYMKCTSYCVGGVSGEVGGEKWTSTAVGHCSVHNESGVN